jgi:hypothetical protein
MNLLPFALRKVERGSNLAISQDMGTNLEKMSAEAKHC